jgi:hypothetical protein
MRCSRCRRLTLRFGFEEFRLELLLKPVAFAFDVDRDRMAEQAIEYRTGNHTVAEDLGTGAETLIVGNDDSAALLAARDRPEEQVGALAVDRRIADLVPDEWRGCVSTLSRSSSLPSTSALPSVVISAVSVTNSVRTPCSHAFIPSATTRRVLPTPRRPQQQGVLAPLDVTASGATENACVIALN